VCVRASRQFVAATSSAPSARTFVRETLRGWSGDLLEDGPGRDSIATDVELITGELVSNAARSGRSHFVVDLEAHRDHLVLTVADDGEPTAGLASPHGVQPLWREDGRGLLLVAHLSAAWGVRVERGERSWGGVAKEIWARVDLPPQQALQLECSR
jgi:anti-sigma regulatory factor (Ser/Thr protein kinase)